MSGHSFGSRRITLRMRRLRRPKSAAHTEPEDDSVTVSSRDTRLLVQKTKTVMNGGSGSTMQDFHTLYGLESESHASAFDERYPADPSATTRAINGIMTSESVVSDGASLALSRDDLDVQSPFDGDLAVQQDNGHYCYAYTSGSSSSAASASAAHDVADSRDPKLHWLASQKTLAQPQSKSGSSDYPSPSSSSNRQSASSSTSDPLPRTADTPPEVRQLVPPACTDFSTCGVLLDAFRYVRSTCGECTPCPRASPGANGHANGKGKARTDVVDVSIRPGRIRIAHTDGKPSPACLRPLSTLPSAPSASSASSSSMVAGDVGYELCPGCFETAGVAGLPGNLGADDGGHSTSHIMIKIPIPLSSNKVQTASRRARQLWTSRDLLYVQHTPSGCVHADSLQEADAVTIIGSGSKHARGGRCDHKALDHRIACKGCNQCIIGVRFRCATCPATKTQS
ncbi:hypothetical protein DFH11DRAFT_1724221 [Phellopilus nigrolimitatus]|nr:hypothetical protein DFH11DRAFT_1724221 [Phellopilus nigrolimitatus]